MALRPVCILTDQPTAFRSQSERYGSISRLRTFVVAMLVAAGSPNARAVTFSASSRALPRLRPAEAQAVVGPAPNWPGRRSAGLPPTASHQGEGPASAPQARSLFSGVPTTIATNRGTAEECPPQVAGRQPGRASFAYRNFQGRSCRDRGAGAADPSNDNSQRDGMGLFDAKIAKSQVVRTQYGINPGQSRSWALLGALRILPPCNLRGYLDRKCSRD